MMKPKFSQDQLRERREAMAAEVATADIERRRDKIEQVARKYNVSSATVLSACKTAKVKFPRGTRKTAEPTANTLRVIGLLVQGQKAADIARKFKVTPQWISTVRAKALKYGILKEE